MRSFILLAFRIATAAYGCSPRCSANFLFSQNCLPIAPMRDQFSIPRSTKSCPTSKPKSSDAQIVPKGSCRRFLTYFGGPERAKDPDWWDRVLQKDDETWWELHRRNLLDSPKYFEVVLNAHRLANRLRVAREGRR